MAIVLAAAAVFSHTVKGARKQAKKPGSPVCDGLVQRDFTAAVINELWLTDISSPQAGGAPSEDHTGEGKLYMCAVRDARSNRIVGYAIDSRMKSRLAVAAIEDAVARRGEARVVAGCVVHSDRGSQFRSRKFQQALKRHGNIGSMGPGWCGW